MSLTVEQPGGQPSPGAGGILGDGSGGNVNNELPGDAASKPAAEPVNPGATDGAKPGKGDTPPKTDPQQSSEPITGLSPLPENATDEQRADFDKKMRALGGVPGKPEEYGNFGFGDDVKIDTASDDYQFYTGLFHRIGLSKAQAKALLEDHQKRSSEQVAHLQKQSDNVINEYRAQVKRDFVKSVGGDTAFNEYRDVAVRGLKASAQGANLSEKEITGLLNVMSDDPRFIKIFNGIGKLFREDVLVTGAAPKAQEKTFDDMFKDMFKGG